MTPETPPNLSTALKDVVGSATELLKNEARLAREEIKESTQLTREYLHDLIMAEVIMVLGLIPFLAFLVLIFGEWLNGRYWLSSLLVSIVCSGIGLFMYLAAKTKMPDGKVLKSTRRNLETAADSVVNKLNYLKQTTFGGTHGNRGI